MNVAWLKYSLVFFVIFQTSQPMHMARHFGALQEDNQLCPGFSCPCISTTMCCALVYVCCKEHGIYWTVVDWSLQNGADWSKGCVQGYCCATNGAWPCSSQPIINYFEYDQCSHVQTSIRFMQQAELRSFNKTRPSRYAAKMQ